MDWFLESDTSLYLMYSKQPSQDAKGVWLQTEAQNLGKEDETLFLAVDVELTKLFGEVSVSLVG